MESNGIHQDVRRFGNIAIELFDHKIDVHRNNDGTMLLTVFYPDMHVRGPFPAVTENVTDEQIKATILRWKEKVESTQTQKAE